MASTGTILVVDDDPGVRESLSAALSTRYRVHTAASASEALDALCAHSFELILVDYQLPDLLGTAVLQAVKRFFPDIMVIVITGVGNEDVAVQALRGGARDYLRKPIDFRDLHARIGALLPLRHLGNERRSHPSFEEIDPGAQWSGLPAALESADKARAILRGVRYMETHLDSALRLDAVARAAGMSKYHFCRRFKTVTGFSFRDYLARQRISRAKELLLDTGRTITEIFRDVGFKDMTHFGRVFKRLEGQLPSKFRRRGKDDSGPNPAPVRPTGSAN
jgi:YesN/AraC family two-component response regulator